MTAPDRMSGNVLKVFVNTENRYSSSRIRMIGIFGKQPWLSILHFLKAQNVWVFFNMKSLFIQSGNNNHNMRIKIKIVY